MKKSALLSVINTPNENVNDDDIVKNAESFIDRMAGKGK